jgi:hypothetical protein
MQIEFGVNTEIEFLIVTVRFRSTRLRDFFTAAETKAVKGGKAGVTAFATFTGFVGLISEKSQLRCCPQHRAPPEGCIKRSY